MKESQASADPRPNVSIGLSNPKSPENVGSVMRAAGCYQVDAVIYSGIRYGRAAKYNNHDTKRVTDRIPLTGVESLLDGLDEDTKVVCVELVEGAIPLPEYRHPDKVIYIFGPEDGSLTQDIIDAADAVVYVPTIGCMNLAATVNVLLYDRLAKADAHIGNDDLIRQSRDTNNRVKVKGE
ncbi:MAG: tRNA(Leu) C34 or U34 (ribose-2'-O)-methylase TrmL [Phenylobacterium sp.]|jgi:tRNA(Leu) C34 or U34 (ribose-2'-O)-methylase TrmL